ncbi:MAG: polysaccharide biosynthesis C-terminal domain-containing protein, partial [Candidatus Latescibacteria bacterium]|nr:polysaccharide biosynthesis C-terminal domain-containing protein [Candidatus Latescibacterota bacterium]
VLIPRIGLIAAAWSTLAAYGLMALLLFLSVRRFYAVQYEYGRLVKLCVAAGIAYLMIWKYTDDPTLSGILARVVIFLVVYPTILWGWRFFDPAEWRDLRSLLSLTRPQDQDLSTNEARR